MDRMAATPEPPYHVAVFTSQRTEGDDAAYDAMSRRMAERVVEMDGYLGHESVRGADGFGITVSYWRDEGSIARWKADLEHLVAQGRGKASWYASYALRVGTVQRDSGKAWED